MAPAAVVVVMMVAAAAYQAYSQQKAAKEAQKQKEMMADQQEHMGSVVKVKAEAKVRQLRDHTRRLMAQQRAKMASAGVQIHSGSPLDLFVETRVEGEKDAQRVRWLAKQETDVHRFNSNLLEFEGRMLRKQGRRQAFGTMLSGASSATGAGVSTYYGSK